MSMKPLELAGQVINGNLFLEPCGSDKHGRILWLTECVNCGHRMGKNPTATKRTSGVSGCCRNCYGMPTGKGGLKRLFKKYQRQAKRDGRSFELTLEEFQKLTSSDCHYCGSEANQLIKSADETESSWSAYRYNGIDRKNNDIGYTIGNCVPCCWPCNLAKKAQSYETFVAWLERIRWGRKAKLYVLCGMIASGKSSYCRTAARHGLIVVNDDSLVEMIHGGDYSLYKKEFKLIYKSAEQQILSTAIAMNRSVLVDRGLNVSLRGRQRWLALAKSFDVPCEAIVFRNDGPETHARRRANADARGHPLEYWLRVAERHNSLYIIPTVEEGFDAVHHISFDEIQSGKVIL